MADKFFKSGFKDLGFLVSLAHEFMDILAVRLELMLTTKRYFHYRIPSGNSEYEVEEVLNTEWK